MYLDLANMIMQDQGKLVTIQVTGWLNETWLFFSGNFRSTKRCFRESSVSRLTREKVCEKEGKECLSYSKIDKAFPISLVIMLRNTALVHFPIRKGCAITKSRKVKKPGKVKGHHTSTWGEASIFWKTSENIQHKNLYSLFKTRKICLAQPEKYSYGKHFDAIDSFENSYAVGILFVWKRT